MMDAGAIIFNNCFQYTEMDYEAFGSILELRKEKSRDAARSRRGKENYEFYELAKLLPLPAAITSQLDKASIIRLSISYLKLREFSGHGDPPWNRDIHNNKLKGTGRRRNMPNIAMDIFDQHQGTHILQSVDGFVFILANDGRFLYISETVSIYLGLSQVEMTGSSIFDYVHTQDHQELMEHLGLGTTNSSSSPEDLPPDSPSDDGSAPSTPRATTPPTPDRTSYMIPNLDKGLRRTFCVRMKSTLTKRGVHIRTSGYRVVYIAGQLRPQMCFGLNRKLGSQVLGMVGTAIALPPPTITELRIESDTFIMRLNPDFSIIYCDTVISDLCDWSSEDLTGRLMYDICHAGDLGKLKQSHKCLLSKGQVLSEYFRLLNKNGGYVWVQLCATTLYSSKTSDVHTVLAIVYVLSGVDYDGCVMDVNQITIQPKTETRHTECNNKRADAIKHTEPEKQQDGVNSLYTSNNVNEKMDCDPSNTTSNSPPSRKNSVQDSETEKTVQYNGDCRNSPPCFITSHTEKVTEEPTLTNSNDKVNSQKTMYKNSRRKMDRPRKRRRESDIDENENHGYFSDNFCSELPDNTESVQKRLSCNNVIQSRAGQKSSPINGYRPASISSPINGYNSHSQSPKCLEEYNMPVAEDLSLRSISIRQNSQHSASEIHRKSCWQNSNGVDQNGNPALSSVKDLEDVMNKHLPDSTQQGDADIKSASIISEIEATNIVANSLGKQQSAIQWIGASSDSDSLPASNLLRTLYAKRESVIRSSNSSRGQCFSGETTPLSMLIPPGSDVIKDHLTLNIPQISVNSKGTVLPSYTTSSHLTVSTASSLNENFNITPPSSVSPNDKILSPFGMDGNFDPVSVACNNITSSNSMVSMKSQSFPTSLTPIVSDYSCIKTVGYNSVGYHSTEYPHFSVGPNAVSAFDIRPDSWYPV